MGDPFPKNCPFPWGDLHPHLTHYSLGTSNPTIQMASQSVQPFLHRRQQNVPVLYNGMPVSPLKIAPYHGGDLDLCLIRSSLGQLEHIDRFSHFWATVCKTVRPMLSDHCPVCPVRLWHSWTVAKRLDGSRWNLACRLGRDPAPPPLKGLSPPNFRPISVAAKWLHGSRCRLVWR